MALRGLPRSIRSTLDPIRTRVYEGFPFCWLIGHKYLDSADYVMRDTQARYPYFVTVYPCTRCPHWRVEDGS